MYPGKTDFRKLVLELYISSTKSFSWKEVQESWKVAWIL